MLWAHPTTCSVPIKSSAPDPGGLAPPGARRLPHHRRWPWGHEGTWFPIWAPDPGALAAVATFRHPGRSAGVAKQAGIGGGLGERPGGQWDRKYGLSRELGGWEPRGSVRAPGAWPTRAERTLEVSLARPLTEVLAAYVGRRGQGFRFLIRHRLIESPLSPSFRLGTPAPAPQQRKGSTLKRCTCVPCVSSEAGWRLPPPPPQALMRFSLKVPALRPLHGTSVAPDREAGGKLPTDETDRRGAVAPIMRQRRCISLWASPWARPLLEEQPPPRPSVSYQTQNPGAWTASLLKSLGQERLPGRRLRGVALGWALLPVISSERGGPVSPQRPRGRGCGCSTVDVAMTNGAPDYGGRPVGWQ